MLIVLFDDVGFAASSAFGGPIHTPTAERLAKGGLKFNRFHTTALCSPTRQALLTGRNHHSVNMGGICEIATSAPGYTSVLPKNKAPLAMTLKLNGYSTAQFGKCHEVPVWQTSPLGPFDQWPTGGGGFEYFYGFVGGETNQWYPAIYEGTTPVEPEKTPEQGYHFSDDMTNKAIKWTRQQKALMPDKPFFMYFAPGATHAPHHVPKEWADKYKGRFDGGWDKLREEIFARQKQLGVIPANAELTARPAEIPAWDDTPKEHARRSSRARWRSTPVSSSTSTTNLGRLIDALKDLEVLDDTLIYMIIGDNGASAEGTPNGCFNEMASLNGLAGSRRRRSCSRKSTSSADRTLTTTTRWAGHTRSTRPISGPSRWRRTGAARAMALSCTGRTASRRRARFAASSITSSTWRRRSSKRPASRIQRPSTAFSRRRSRASACCMPSTTPRRPIATRRSISRCSATAASTTRAGRR